MDGQGVPIHPCHYPGEVGQLPQGKGMVQIIVKTQAVGGGFTIHQYLGGHTPEGDYGHKAREVLHGLGYGHQFFLRVSPHKFKETAEALEPMSDNAGDSRARIPRGAGEQVVLTGP